MVLEFKTGIHQLTGLDLEGILHVTSIWKVGFWYLFCKMVYLTILTIEVAPVDKWSKSKWNIFRGLMLFHWAITDCLNQKIIFLLQKNLSMGMMWRNLFCLIPPISAKYVILLHRTNTTILPSNAPMCYLFMLNLIDDALTDPGFSLLGHWWRHHQKIWPIVAVIS